MPRRKNQSSDPPLDAEAVAKAITGRVMSSVYGERKILAVNQLRGGDTKYSVVTDKGPSIPVSNITQFAREHGLIE